MEMIKEKINDHGNLVGANTYQLIMQQMAGMIEQLVKEEINTRKSSKANSIQQTPKVYQKDNDHSKEKNLFTLFKFSTDKDYCTVS